MGGLWFFSSSIIAATRFQVLRTLRAEDAALLTPDERADIEYQDEALPPDMITAHALRKHEEWAEEELTGFFSEKDKKPVTLTGVITPVGRNKEGLLIKASSVALAELMQSLDKNWQQAYEIDPRAWEEIIAAAYQETGFDEVILTPRSGDAGRDVIAMRKGLGSIRIIGSVKAQSPHRLVAYDDVRALLGVLSGDQKASKGVVLTTSDFPTNILKDPFIAPFVPTRLELVNGVGLRSWFKELLLSKP